MEQQTNTGVVPRPMTVIIWLCGILFALMLDGWVAHRVGPIASYVKRHVLAHEVKEFGHFGFAAFFAIFVTILHASRWRGGALICLSAGLAGTLNAILKWMIGRTRPSVKIDPFGVDPFRNGLFGVFDTTNLTFPSGHTVTAFAAASALAQLMPRAAWAFYAVASAVALERVLEKAHYLSDTVAAAALGILCTRILHHAFRPRAAPASKIVLTPGPRAATG